MPYLSDSNFKIAKGAVVCSEALLIGDITIGERDLIHDTKACGIVKNSFGVQ